MKLLLAKLIVGLVIFLLLGALALLICIISPLIFLATLAGAAIVIGIDWAVETLVGENDDEHK